MSSSGTPTARSMIAGSFGGIQPMHEVFYLAAITYSADAAGRALERYRRLSLPYLEHGPDYIGDNDEGVVSAVHEALNHCGGLSKVFWSPDKKDRLAQARARKLRDAFELEDSSALNNRALRNALEHFDERLDDFLMEDPVGMMFPGGMIGPAELADQRPGQIFRLVDPWSRVFVVFNEKYPFQGVFDEMDRIGGLARAFMETGRLPRKA